MKPLRFLFFFCAGLLFTIAAAQDLVPIPQLKTRVTDVAGMLKPDQRATLEKTLQEHEAKTGSQVAVLIVNNTSPEEIAQYGIRVADAWKIGRKGIDDGVILIISKDNRKMRLEVGRGAEGSITDAQSKRILQNVIAPRFRQNDFYGGINDAVAVIHALLDKEAFPPALQAEAEKGARNDDTPLILFILLPIIIIAAIVNIVRRARSFGGIIIGGGWGAGGGDSNSGDFGGSDFGGGGGDFGGGGASGSW